MSLVEVGILFALVVWALIMVGGIASMRREARRLQRAREANERRRRALGAP